jgi:hypothetical protein
MGQSTSCHLYVREDEQWGEVLTPKSFCDEIGDNPVFYDAHETELGLTPEDNLPGSTPSGPCVLKWWFLGLMCLILGYILGTFASSIAPELSPHAVPFTVGVRVLTSTARSSSINPYCIPPLLMMTISIPTCLEEIVLSIMVS